ncbi:MAG TPA: cytochrome c [Vicinamibacterales bacterium]|jgi:mono/diheme cytochrome c family protein
MTSRWTLVAAAVFGFGVAGLGSVRTPAASPDDTAPANPTFTRDVLPIFQKSCQDCHRPGQMAPFSLLDYESTRPWVRSIKEKVASRYMPPWHLDRTIGEYDPDPSLTDQQIATIVKWVDSGSPKGDPKDAPPARVFPASDKWQFGEEPDLIVTSPPITIPANGPDLYPEPEAATNMAENRYIKWIQVMPGDTQVVHHTLVFAVQDLPSNGMPVIPGLSLGSGSGGGRGGPSIRALTRQENGGARIVTSMLTEYARGNDGDIFDDGQAKMLAAGSSLRWQFHYHPNGKTTVVDRTRVGIKFWPKGWQPKHLISTMALASPETLAIAPGDANARSDSYFPLAGPARLLSYQPHMHYRGKRMVLEAILPSGQVQTLTDVNRFTWTWQITYPYKNRPAFPKGTVLHSIAYHDNSPANKENPDPTAFVGWGDRTVDEMNIGWLDFYYISDEEFVALQKEPTATQSKPE